MDLCTGTGSVAVETAQNSDCVVVGVDLSPEMLKRARSKVLRSGLQNHIPLVMGRAECLPFPNRCFDAVCFTYLLRYVEDPEATMKEIVRVLKPNGQLVSLEFGVPQNSVARGLWHVYTRRFLPLTAQFISYQWHEVALFLGRSISALYRSYSVERIRQIWSSVGIRDVEVKPLSFGAAVVMWGTKGGREEAQD
jgi:demethylmenaquinone methyltransferase/2-methoxy-6-polyprenyl-1,4-benzoquinol methylase